MDAMDLMLKDPTEVVAFMTQWRANTKDWNAIRKELDVREHEVFKDPNYLDDVRGKHIDKKTRIGLAEQEMYVDRIISLMFGIDVQRDYQTGDDATLKEVAKVIESVFTKNRINSLNRSRFKHYFGACQMATLWQGVEGKTVNYGGKTSKIKIQNRVFAPDKGDSLHPLYDEWGDLIAFGIMFNRNNGVATNGNKLTDRYFILSTDKGVRTFKSNGSNWLQVGDIQGVQIGKIPITFIERPLPIWGNTSNLTTEKEWILSRNGNYIRHNSAPRKVLSLQETETMDFNSLLEQVNITLGLAKVNADGEVVTVPESERTSKANLDSFDYTLPSGSDLKMVEWEGAVQASEFELDQLDRRQDKLIRLPDMSFASLSNISTETMRIALEDARLKVLDESGKVIECMSREINIIKEFIKPMFPGKEAQIDALEVEVIVTPFQVDDEYLRAQITQIKNGGKPTIGHKQSVIDENGAEKGELIWREIEDENMADMTKSVNGFENF